MAQIVRTIDRPDLVPLVSHWIWEAFGRQAGETLADSTARVAACTADIGPDQSFVLLVDDVPAGTAGFVRHDLDERPDLSPWLAGVYVAPEFRGRNLVKLLIEAVERAATEAGVQTLWLYTGTAERIYERAGWETVELLARPDRRTALMCRRLTAKPD